MLLYRASEDIWIALTPGHDLACVKLLDARHEALERRAPFPAHLANQVYANDLISGAALALVGPRSGRLGIGG